jgi:hypothetical protein
MENKIITIVSVLLIALSVTNGSAVYHTPANTTYRELDSCDVKNYILVKEAVEESLSKCKFKSLLKLENKIWIGYKPDTNLIFSNIQVLDQLKDSAFNSEIKNYILKRYDSCTVFEADEYGVPRVFVVPIKVSKGEVTFM